MLHCDSKILERARWSLMRLADEAGTGGGGADPEDDNADQQAGGEGDDDPGDNAESPDKDQITMTQAKLDALLKRQYRKGMRAAKTADKQDDSSGDDKAAEELAEKLAAANDRLLRGTIKDLGGDLLTPNGIKAAAKLTDFADCFDDRGELDEEAVKDRLEELVKDYPEFARPKKDQDAAPGKGQSWGTRHKVAAEADDGITAAFKRLNPDIKI